MPAVRIVSKRHQVRRIVEQVINTPWQVTPEKLSEITELLELRANGYELTEEEIAMRVGSRRDSSDDIEIVNRVAVITLRDTIFQRANLITRYSGGTSLEIFRSYLRQASQDNDVSAIVIDIDSPGGTAIGPREAFDDIREIDQNIKPVYASVNGLAASAAYKIAVGARKIFASQSSYIGSIGTYTVHRESSAAMEKAGIKFNVIRSGQYKTDGNPYEPLSEQARANIQERVTAVHQLFLETVALGRDVSVAQVVEQFGDGKIFLANEALQRNMIDEIATLEQVITRIGGSASSPSRTVVNSKEEEIMDKRLKAALFARGIISSAECPDEVCEAALTAYFQGIGIKRPEDPAECLEALNNGKQLVLTSINEEDLATVKSAAGKVETIQTAETATTDETEIRQAERFRINEINSMAEQLGNVPEELVSQAIDRGTTPEEFAKTAIKARSSQLDPVQPIRHIESQVDRFNDCAVAALLQRMGYEPTQDNLGGLQGHSLMDIASCALSAYDMTYSGGRPTQRQVAAKFLEVGGEHEQIGISADAGTNAPAYSGSANFPNLLSVLANKMLDRAMQAAPATYPQWTARLPDVADFKPATIASAGEFNRLPKHKLGRPFEQTTFAEGTSWIQVDSYGDEFVMTPDMIVNDDLDAFMQAMNSRGSSHELTLNELVVNLLLSNPRTADGLQMFDASHNNVVTGGGGPDSAQLKKMRLLHRRQLGVSKVNKLRYDASIVLAGPEWETELEQTLQAVQYPQVESETNTFRGRYTPVIETMLDDYSNNKIWYTLVAPGTMRGIVHAFQTGYGRGGNRRSYFFQPTQCRHFQLEGRFAAAAVNSQAIVQNPGS